MNLSLSTASTESHRFWVDVFSFSFVSIHFFFISSVLCWLFRSVLFSLHVFVFLIAFFLPLISILTSLQSEKMLEMISFFYLFFFNFPRLDLWPRMIYPGVCSVCT